MGEQRDRVLGPTFRVARTKGYGYDVDGVRSVFLTLLYRPQHDLSVNGKSTSCYLVDCKLNR